MKLRTLTELVDNLDTELAWRKRELSVMRSEIVSRTGLTQAMLLRAGQALLYAHWEGFIKDACRTYIRYVAQRRLPLKNLSDSFVAICLRGHLNALTDSTGPRPAIEIVRLVRSEGSASYPLSDEVVRTDSNLSSSVLSRILATIGLDGESFALKDNLIDELLVKRRNEIAHGRMLQVGVQDYLDVADEVVAMIDAIRSEIIDHAASSRYAVT